MAIAFPTKPSADTKTSAAAADPLDQLAVRIARLIAAEQSNTTAQKNTAGDQGERSSLHRQWLILDDELVATQATAACLPATTMRGAMLQVMLASDRASHLLDVATGASTDSDREIDVTKAHRAISSCLYSILGFLSRASGIDREALGSECMMPQYLDPHRQRVNALAATEEV